MSINASDLKGLLGKSILESVVEEYAREIDVHVRDMFEHNNFLDEHLSIADKKKLLLIVLLEDEDITTTRR